MIAKGSKIHERQFLSKNEIFAGEKLEVNDEDFGLYCADFQKELVDYKILSERLDRQVAENLVRIKYIKQDGSGEWMVAQDSAEEFKLYADEKRKGKGTGDFFGEPDEHMYGKWLLAAVKKNAREGYEPKKHNAAVLGLLKRAELDDAIKIEDVNSIIQGEALPSEGLQQKLNPVIASVLAVDVDVIEAALARSRVQFRGECQEEDLQHPNAKTASAASVDVHKGSRTKSV